MGEMRDRDGKITDICGSPSWRDMRLQTEPVEGEMKEGFCEICGEHFATGETCSFSTRRPVGG